jgi:hypothetical protein
LLTCKTAFEVPGLTAYRIGSQSELVALARERGWIEGVRGEAHTDVLPHVVFREGAVQGTLPAAALENVPSFRLRIPRACLHGPNMSLLIEDRVFPGGFVHSMIPSPRWEWLTDDTIRLKPALCTRTLVPTASMVGVLAHWGHFFVDALDRLLHLSDLPASDSLLLVSDPDFFNLSPTLNEMGIVPQVDELMRLLGIHPNRPLLPLPKSHDFEVEDLALTTLRSTKPAISADSLREVRSRALGAASAAQDDYRSTIFVGRLDVKKRFIVGQDEVVRHLRDCHRADTVFPEMLTVAGAIERFSRSSRVILPAGSAKFNLAFCRPGTKVVCVTPKGYLSPTAGVALMVRHLCAALGIRLAFYGVDFDAGAKLLINANLRISTDDIDSMVDLLEDMP